MRVKNTVRQLFVYFTLMIGGGLFLYSSSSPSENYHRLLKKGTNSHTPLERYNTTKTVSEIMYTYKQGMKQNSTREMKYILYWDLPPNSRRVLGQGSEPFEQCAFSQCSLTTNRTLFPVENYHALMFCIRDFTFKDFPEKRTESQRYIMWTLEAPAYAGLDKTKMKDMGGVFNWTFTYRSDSDIVGPYGWFEPLAPPSEEIYTQEYRKKQLLLDGTNYAKGKTRLVAWFVSNCGAISKRDNYAKKLQEYVEVDIFGRCSKMKCRKCDEMLRKDYKFYLAFENSNCVDYVTEKFYRTLKMGAIPIVYSGADYSKIAPPHSYIDIRNYKTARELADYLTLLDTNDELYNEYFWWTKLYKVYYEVKDSRQALCGLCAKLHLDKEPKIYENLEQWWKTGSNCTKPENSSFPVWKE